MPQRKYKSVNLPTEMIDEIYKIVKKRKNLGFVSVDDFVRDAVRENIIKFEMK